MAPIATTLGDSLKNAIPKAQNGHSNGHEVKTTPIKSTGALDQYEFFDLTPVIGREFPKANLVELLEAPNSDELLTELAYTSM